MRVLFFFVFCVVFVDCCFLVRGNYIVTAYDGEAERAGGGGVLNRSG